MSQTTGSSFIISESRIPDFRYSLKKILLAPPPTGLRGSYDFGKSLKDSDKHEFFYFKYALIDYFLQEEKVSSSIRQLFRDDAANMSKDFVRTDLSLNKGEQNQRLKFYSDKFPRIFGKNRFNESSELEYELYRHVYQKLFNNKFIGRSKEEWQHWFVSHENELEIIPHFIIWYHEAVLTVLTLYNESLWSENFES